MSLRDKLKSRTFNGQNFSEKVPKYGYFIDDKTHERVFGKIGLVDRQADVQSELATCDYSLLMANLTTSLDDFNYSDFIDILPSFDTSDPLSLIVAREQCELAYKSLPKEIKAKYENNPRKFTAAVANGQFIADTVDYAPQPFDEEDKKAAVGSAATAQSDLLKQLDELKQQLVDLRGANSATPVADAGARVENQGGQK